MIAAGPDILTVDQHLTQLGLIHAVRELVLSFETDRLRSNLEFNAKKTGKSAAELRQIRTNANPSGRFGTIEEFGDACAFLCSAQAGFITGQNLLMDGGQYPGTF